MKFFKEKKSIIISFIIGVIIASSITVYAYSYYAKDIGYTKPGTNTEISVEDALNDLYSEIKNSNELYIKEFQALNNGNLNTHAYAQLILDVDSFNYISFDSITAKYTNKLTYFRIYDKSNGNENKIYEINELTSEKQVINISNLDKIMLVIYDSSRPKAYDTLYVNNIKLYK